MFELGPAEFWRNKRKIPQLPMPWKRRLAAPKDEPSVPSLEVTLATVHISYDILVMAY